MNNSNENIESYVVENAVGTPYEEMEYHIILAMTRETAANIAKALAYSRHMNVMFHGLESALQEMILSSKNMEREERYNFLMEHKRSELARMVIELEDEVTRP